MNTLSPKRIYLSVQRKIDLSNKHLENKASQLAIAFLQNGELPAKDFSLNSMLLEKNAGRLLTFSAAHAQELAYITYITQVTRTLVDCYHLDKF